MIEPWRNGDLLEELCFLRRLYERRGTADREPVLSPTAAVAYGEMLMRIARRRDAARGRRNAKPAS